MELRQIMLVTDGESNIGVSPLVIAKEAYEKGIRVNTIGIVKNKNIESSLLEIEHIAINGGGISEITDLGNLSETLSKVTVKSIHRTIEEVINKELKEILDKDLKEVPPSPRRKIVEMLDRLGNEVSIKCLIIMDTSGSMNDKINAAKRSVLELLRFLKERSGKTEIGVIVYPGEKAFYEILCDFTDDIKILEESMNKICVGGTTPTGPALGGGIRMMTNEEKDGALSDYIV